MTNYKLAIFDFDGTLADSFPWFCSVVNQTAERFDFRKVAPDEIDDLRQLGSREVVARLGVPIWKIPMIAVYMRKLAAQNARDIPLFPEAIDTISRLSAGGLNLALVSSNAEATIRQILGPVSDTIHFACGASLWGKSAKFREVLKHFGVDHSQAIGIGDEIRDIDSARTAGIAAGSVTFGYNSRDALMAKNPDLLFDTYADMLKALLPQT